MTDLIKHENSLYILMISPHGLISGNNMELGRDADTGGQITYVVELLRALARHSEIRQVDLLTRLIDDPAISMDYSQSIEEIDGNARILRLPFGPKLYVPAVLAICHLVA